MKIEKKLFPKSCTSAVYLYLLGQRIFQSASKL